jgi:hypothetical protein
MPVCSGIQETGTLSEKSTAPGNTAGDDSGRYPVMVLKNDFNSFPCLIKRSGKLFFFGALR